MPRTSPYDRLTDRQAKTMLKELDRALEYAEGSWAKLAERLSSHTGDSLSAQAVFSWAVRGVPAERAVDLEHATDGYVVRQRLRPDLFEGMRAS